MKAEGRDRYRDQIATCDVGVFRIPRYIHCSLVSELASCAFSTICPFFKLKNFFHLLVYTCTTKLEPVHTKCGVKQDIYVHIRSVNSLV